MVGTVTIIVTPRLYKADITIHSSSYPFSSYTRTRYIGCNDLKKLVVNKIWHHCTGKKYQMKDTGKPNIHIYKILDHCRTFPFVISSHICKWSWGGSMDFRKYWKHTCSMCTRSKEAPFEQKNLKNLKNLNNSLKKIHLFFFSFFL